MRSRLQQQQQSHRDTAATETVRSHSSREEDNSTETISEAGKVSQGDTGATETVIERKIAAPRQYEDQQQQSVIERFSSDRDSAVSQQQRGRQQQL